MSELKNNPRTDSIVRIEDYIRYAGTYHDDYGNTWRVSILGLLEDVMSIMNERKFRMKATPEQDEEAFHAAMDQALLLGNDLDFSPDIEEDASLQLPGLRVEITLEEIAEPQQKHVIQIEFDPSIQENPHFWGINLNRPQDDFTFNIRATQGSVSSTSSKSNNGARWDAKVVRKSGNPAEYDMKSAAVRLA